MNRKTFRGIEGYLSSSAHLVLRWAKKQWKSGKLILQGKEYAFISPDGSSELNWLPLWKICLRGAAGSKQRRKDTTPGRKKFQYRPMAALKIAKKHCPRRHQPNDLPATAAKSLQLCPTLCDPVPGILQARTLEWVAISFSSA